MTERRGILACRVRLRRWVTLSAAVLSVLVWGLPAPTAGAQAIPPPRPQAPAAGDLAPGPSDVHAAAAVGDNGADYRMVAADGGIFDFGDATFHGSTGSVSLNRPMVGMAATADGGGYWLVASDGGIFAFGDAGFFGSAGGETLWAPVVGMAATADGGGYWEVSADGFVQAFGDAGFYGSLAGRPLRKPVVGMAATPDGAGYWLVASDGGIFAFGDAVFAGSTGSIRLNKPVVGMAASPDGAGYWLVASDGGIFAFGSAVFAGSTGSIRLNKPVVGMAASPDGIGYWLVASDGGIFTFGNARFHGSTGSVHLNQPIVSMAAGPGPLGSPSYNACRGLDQPLPGQGPVLAESVAVPALPAAPIPGAPGPFQPRPGDVPRAYQATLSRPDDSGRFPGARPGVVLLHGLGGDQCQLWWLARYLAGAGYVTLTLTSPTIAFALASYGVAIDAARSAVHYLATPQENPFGAVTDPGAVGIAGWSEGSVAASVAQGLPDTGAVGAIVALDNLRGSLLGDSGAPFTFCVPPTQGPVVARAPALGFASDRVCPSRPSDSSSSLKQSGWSRWRAAGVASVELPLAGYDHLVFSYPSSRMVPVARLAQAWFDAWLGRRPEALTVFTACLPTNPAGPGTFSATFQAGAFLPSLGIDSSTWGLDLATRCGQPTSVVGTTPVP